MTLAPSVAAMVSGDGRGMPCKCGGCTMVIDSRLNVDGSIRRRRHCKSCSQRFTTYERSEEAIRGQLPKSARPQLAVLRQEVQALLDRIIRIEMSGDQ